MEAVRWQENGTAGETRFGTRHLFIFIGAEPHTAWLAGSGVESDSRGFVLSGTNLTPARPPLQTSRSGVFVIGDVRANSTKRVAAAVDKGAQAVAALHAFLKLQSARLPAAE